MADEATSRNSACDPGVFITFDVYCTTIKVYLIPYQCHGVPSLSCHEQNVFLSLTRRMLVFYYACVPDRTCKAAQRCRRGSPEFVDSVTGLSGLGRASGLSQGTVRWGQEGMQMEGERVSEKRERCLRN